MSLYDTIKCDYPLPDAELQNEEFQTKDLEEMLNRYLIDTDGKLWRLRRGVNFFGENDPPPNIVETDRMEDMHYHGDICFYADTKKGWVEYSVRFTHGTVEWIRRNEEKASAER